MKILVGTTECQSEIIQDCGIDKIVWLEKEGSGRKSCKELSLDQEDLLYDSYFQKKKEECKKETAYYCAFLLEQIGTALNRYHDVYYTGSQWKILLDYWLDKLTISFYAKYIKLKKVIDLYGKENIGIISLQEDAYYAPKEIIDFLLTAREDDRFSMRQYTDLAGWLGIQSYGVSESRNDSEHAALVANVAAKEKAEYDRECRVLLYKSYLPENVIAHAVKATNAAVQKYTEIPSNHIFWTMKHMQVKYADRNGLNLKIDNQDDFLRFLAGVWAKYVPVSYLEGFPALCGMAESCFDVSPKVVVSAPAGLTHDDVFKAFLMMNEEKIDIYDVQHGGNYGVIDNINAGERAVSKKFYTFGWKEEKYRAECVPMPAAVGIPYLATGLIGRPNGRYLYTTYQPVKYRIDFDEPYTMDELEQAEHEFFGTLDRDVIDKFIVRHYANFRDSVDRRAFYRQNFPPVMLRNHLPFWKELMSAALMVAPSMDTTYLEAMWMNKPLIIFYPDGMYTPTKHAVKFLDALKDVGVLHDSPKSAAETLNKIKGCETEWWMQRERQKAVEEFKKQYAYLPEDAIEQWENELIRICEEVV